MRRARSGFTLMELMMSVTIIAILALIGFLNYNNSVRKASEGLTKGNLGALRSALSIYYSTNDGIYPIDNLASITNGSPYLWTTPVTRLLPYHQETTLVKNESTPSETGGWSYNNVDSDPSWGTVVVGCFHQDSRGQTWTSY
jgi:prepilin-type N-terminal cleavage/methylation domain-containing protein